MRRTHPWLAVVFVFAVFAPSAHTEPKSKAATKADVDRLEKRVDDQQKQLEKLAKTQAQYMQAIKGMFEAKDDAKPPPPDDVKPVADVKPVEDPKPPVDTKSVPVKAITKQPVKTVETKAPVKKVEVKKPDAVGTIVGKITGAGDAVIYVDDIVVTTRGTAAMKQEGKQFLPNVLIVQKGTTVSFPNMDAIFHNVFSVTPDHSFDLGSYSQGDSKSVTMSKTGVVSVYCNMHPQMVGHILVVPNGNYVRVGKDGFYRMTNIPAGRHRVVAWAPNAKPVTAEAEVTDNGVVTLELELKKGRSGAHTKKDGLPYGSYAE